MSVTGMRMASGVDGRDDINRYWDPVHRVKAAKILPGQFYVCREEEMIVTVLGSCVAACVRDTGAGVGGMNHFMLPDGDTASMDTYGAAERYGQFAMEALINGVLAAGGRRNRLEVKLAGGGRVLKGSLGIGERNIDFAHRFLATDGLAVTAEDVGGDHPRKVYYFPKTGRLRVKKLRQVANATIEGREDEYMRSIAAGSSGEVELF